MLGSLAEDVECQSPCVDDPLLRKHRICKNGFRAAHPIVIINAYFTTPSDTQFIIMLIFNL